MRHLPSRLAFVAATALSLSAPAQDPAGRIANDTKTFRIVRTATPPVVDGTLDDDVWQQADLVDDFHQIRPNDGAPPSEKTEVRLLYDADYLYIGAHLFDSEPDRITANVMVHGSALGQDDRLAIVIDPFNTGRNGYRFETNANGVRHDMLYKNISELQRDWTVIWDTASTVDELGWAFEMAIPFKSLPFNPNLDTWGINFARGIRRKGEEVVWVSRNRSYNPSIVGRVTGFEGMDQGLGLDVVPSVAVNRRREFGSSSSTTDTEPSLDVFYRITPSLNGSLTFNTDFSATEVDDRQVNLTRFNLFFPEKRDFFLNDSDLFEFGRIGSHENIGASQASRQSGRPFFSRRLGLSSTGDQVDLDYGGKLSGRAGRWSIGALAVRQDEFQAIEASDVFVGRIQADVLNESSVGIVLTEGDPTSNLDNSVAGLDFLYLNTALAGGRTLEGQAWFQSSTTEGVVGEDSAFGLGINMPNAAGFRGGLAVKELERNFNPALGFVSRAGVRDYTAEVGYTHFVSRGFLQSVFSGIDLQRIDFLDGGLQTEILVWRLLELESRTRDTFEILYTTNEEIVIAPFTIYADGTRTVVVPTGRYTFDDYGFEIATGNQRKVSAGFGYTGGDFYDGERRNVSGNVEWRPAPKFNLRLGYDWNDIELPQGQFTARLVQFRTQYSFSLQLSWANLIQYDNVSEVVGFNSRLHWIPRAGREGFIVLNHNLQDFDKDNDFESALSDLSVKFGYTFRF